MDFLQSAKFLISEEGKNFIYLIDNLGKLKIISPEMIRIEGFKNTFNDIDINAFASTYIQNTRTFESFLALIPENIVKQINNGSLWNEDLDLHEDISIFSIYIDDTFKHICPQSGFCIAVGQYTKQIYDYFLGFTNFWLVSDPVKEIGGGSGNGFVYEISYEREQYKAKSVLKSSKLGPADNLLYEYLVGQYINKQCSVFSCFIQTYGWFKYKSEKLWENMSEGVTINSIKLIDGIIKGEDELKPIRLDGQQPCFRDKKDIRTRRRCTEVESILGFACTNSKYLSILIEHVEGKTLHSMMSDPAFVNHELLYVLYQVYMPLSKLAYEFTHYDLHTKNVLVYEPFPGKYIEYKYEFEDGEIVEFKSKYIAKIIDYGRSYFDDPSNGENITGSSTKIYANICENVGECNYQSQVCGENHGFKRLGKNSSTVMSSVRNMSHDLLLLKRVQKLIKDSGGVIQPSKQFSDMLKKVNPNEEDSVEKSNSGSGNIENVVDAHNELKKLVIANKIKNYEKFDSVGSLTIYERKEPMKFILHAGGQSVESLKRDDSDTQASQASTSQTKSVRSVDQAQLVESISQFTTDYVTNGQITTVVGLSNALGILANQVMRLRELRARDMVRSTIINIGTRAQQVNAFDLLNEYIESNQSRFQDFDNEPSLSRPSGRLVIFMNRVSSALEKLLLGKLLLA